MNTSATFTDFARNMKCPYCQGKMVFWYEEGEELLKCIESNGHGFTMRNTSHYVLRIIKDHQYDCSVVTNSVFSKMTVYDFKNRQYLINQTINPPMIDDLKPLMDHLINKMDGLKAFL